jgi:hypothetical protein
MRRFERHFDGDSARLTAAEIGLAEAETYAHLGVLSRGSSRRAEVGWLLRALRSKLGYLTAWRGLLAAMTPATIRRLLRRLRGSSGEWERQCLSPSNRPEAVL